MIVVCSSNILTHRGLKEGASTFITLLSSQPWLSEIFGGFRPQRVLSPILKKSFKSPLYKILYTPLLSYRTSFHKIYIPFRNYSFSPIHSHKSCFLPIQKNILKNIKFGHWRLKEIKRISIWRLWKLNIYFRRIRLRHPTVF